MYRVSPYTVPLPDDVLARYEYPWQAQQAVRETILALLAMQDVRHLTRELAELSWEFHLPHYPQYRVYSNSNTPPGRCRFYVGPRGGTVTWLGTTARRTGGTRRWVKDPERWEIPVQVRVHFGTWHNQLAFSSRSDVISHAYADDYHVPEQCSAWAKYLDALERRRKQRGSHAR